MPNITVHALLSIFHAITFSVSHIIKKIQQSEKEYTVLMNEHKKNAAAAAIFLFFCVALKGLKENQLQIEFWGYGWANIRY